MFIPSSSVANWHDLERQVNTLFQEMGYYTEIQKKVNLGSRGKKEIDVYIRDDRASVNQIMLVDFATMKPNEDSLSMLAISVIWMVPAST